MSDVFLSYAKEDRGRVELLAKALQSTGWSVFWDRTIPAGQTWRSFIGKELENAKCVVVAWSAASVESDWVLEEAELAKRRGALIPVFMQLVEPPFGFGSLQGADLSTWEGVVEALAFRRLVRDMGRNIGAPPSRIEVEEAKAIHRTEEEDLSSAGAQRVPTACRVEEPARGMVVPSRAGTSTAVRFANSAILGVVSFLIAFYASWVLIEVVSGDSSDSPQTLVGSVVVGTLVAVVMIAWYRRRR